MSTPDTITTAVLRTRLEAVRTARGLTPGEASLRMGHRVSYWRTMTTAANPRVLTLLRMAAMLEVSPASLFLSEKAWDLLPPLRPFLRP